MDSPPGRVLYASIFSSTNRRSIFSDFFSAVTAFGSRPSSALPRLAPNATIAMASSLPPCAEGPGLPAATIWKLYGFSHSSKSSSKVASNVGASYMELPATGLRSSSYLPNSANSLALSVRNASGSAIKDRSCLKAPRPGASASNTSRNFTVALSSLTGCLDSATR